MAQLSRKKHLRALVESDGGLPRPPDTLSEEDKYANEQLVADIADMLTQGASATQIVSALRKSSSQEISATLAQHRRKAALAIYANVVDRLHELTDRHYTVLQMVLAELEARVDAGELSTLKMKDLLKVADTLTRWIKPVNDAIVLRQHREKFDQDEAPQNITIANVLSIVNEIHKVKGEAERELDARGATSHRSLPRSAIDDAEIIDIADQNARPAFADPEAQAETSDSDTAGSTSPSTT